MRLFSRLPRPPHQQRHELTLLRRDEWLERSNNPQVFQRAFNNIEHCSRPACPRRVSMSSGLA